MVSNAHKFWSNLSGALSYLSTMLVVSVICWTIYVWKVLPNFAEMYANMGLSLPEFTQRLLFLSDEQGFLPFLGVGVLALLVLGMGLHLGWSVQRFAPLKGPLLWIPGFSHLAKLHNQNILLAAATIVDATLAEDQPITVAASWLELDLHHHLPIEETGWEEMFLAEELGTSGSEIRYWLRESQDFFREQMHRFSRKMVTVLQLFVTVLMFALLVAMYLPIFQLAETVG